MANTKTNRQTIAAIKRYRTAQITKMITRSVVLHRRGKQEEMYSMLGDGMVELGGVYVKFLQGVLLQSEKMRYWKNPDKLKIFDRLDSEPLDIVQLLRNELPTDKLSLIKDIQPEPFAAGSFGQVYYGTHANGSKVIVKVLRPMIAETLRYDLRLLGRLSKSVSKRFFNNSSVDMSIAFKEFAAATLNETDYRGEAEFAAEQYEAYKNHPKLVVPRTYLDLCTDKIIVQDYVEGVAASYLVSLIDQGVDVVDWVKDQTGSDLDAQLSTLSYELLLGTFTLPRIMGDPHPGNVKLLPDNKVGLIDFGIYARPVHNQAAYLGMLKEYDKLNKGELDIVSLFTSTLRFFGGDLYRALISVGSIAAKDVDLNKELSKAVESNFYEMSGGQDFKEIVRSPKAITLINKAANNNNKFGFIIKIESSELLRAAQSVINLMDSLGRYQAVIPGVYEKIIQEVEQSRPDLVRTQDDAMPTSQAIDIVTEWLERVADRDPALFQSLINKLRLKDSTINHTANASETVNSPS